MAQIVHGPATARFCVHVHCFLPLPSRAMQMSGVLATTWGYVGIWQPRDPGPIKILLVWAATQGHDKILAEASAEGQI